MNFEYNRTYNKLKYAVDSLTSLEEELELYKNNKIDDNIYKKDRSPIKNKLLYLFLGELQTMNIERGFPDGLEKEYQKIIDNITKYGSYSDTLGRINEKTALNIAITIEKLCVQMEKYKD